jgi:hypothetical protein
MCDTEAIEQGMDGLHYKLVRPVYTMKSESHESLEG